MIKEKNSFGVLKDLGFEKLTEKQQLELLIDKSFYESFGSYRIKSSDFIDLNKKIEIINSKTDIAPSYKLREEFHLFLTTTFNNEVDKSFFYFFKDFEEEIFGMDYVDHKKIALKQFKEVFSKINSTNVSLNYKTISNKGVEGVKTINRFKFLEGLRSGIISELATNTNLKAYLLGKERYFQSNEFKEQEILNKALDFESSLKILKSLNDKYKFEEENISKTNAQSIYEKYSKEFDSIKVLEFIELIMTDKKYQIRKYALGLFYALKKELKLTTFSADKFNQLLTEYFDCNFKNLLLGNSSAKSHIIKVEMFKSMYEEFISKS